MWKKYLHTNQFLNKQRNSATVRNDVTFIGSHQRTNMMPTHFFISYYCQFLVVPVVANQKVCRCVCQCARVLKSWSKVSRSGRCRLSSRSSLLTRRTDPGAARAPCTAADTSANLTTHTHTHTIKKHADRDESAGVNAKRGKHWHGIDFIYILPNLSTAESIRVLV